MKFYIPENLDLKTLLKENQFEFIPNRKYREEVFYFIINLLYTTPASNKKILTEEEFVPLNSAELNSHFAGYKRYIRFLLKVGIIETDNYYITKENATDKHPFKFKGYKLTEKYLVSPKIIHCRDKKLVKADCLRSRMSLTQKRKYSHLIKWFNPSLKINDVDATLYLEDWYRKMEQDPELWDFTKKATLKHPINTKLAGLVGIDLIKNKDFIYTVDHTSHRFHSNLTNLKKDLRHFITYDGESLTGIDLKNAQPYLALILFDENFWLNKAPYLNLKDLSQYEGMKEFLEMQVGSNSSIYHMLDKIAEIKTSNGFQAYKNLVSTGKLYAHLDNEIKEEYSLSDGIDNLKQEFIKGWYAGNGYRSIIKSQFKKIFPEIDEFFTLLKRGDKRRLPVLLQSIESHIFLLRITKRIAHEMTDLPIFTIHDNIVTLNTYKGRIVEIAKDELATAVGVAPEFGIEEWNSKNLPNVDLTRKEKTWGIQVIYDQEGFENWEEKFGEM